MIQLGVYNLLEVHKETENGLYLKDNEGQEVLLPNKFKTEEMQIGDKLEVFVHSDSQNRFVATTQIPKIKLGEFATLWVTEVNMIGAFCNWGMDKDLFIPYRNQLKELVSNRQYVVHLYLDEKSKRLTGTTILKPYLTPIADEDIKSGDEVDIIVFAESNLGYSVIVNQKYEGLVYENESEEILRRGQYLKAWVKPIRDDGKIDLSIKPIGHKSIEPAGQKVLDLLKTSDGFLPYSDKSDAKKIKEFFGMSKKLFKKAIGGLYKQRLIKIEKSGIHLLAD
jgi:predicted RNA-binding protein (virulence factor B family)